jgi:putative DNA-binding protein
VALKLKDFQDRFQRAILEGNDAILENLTDGARETRANLLKVYRDGYVLRLIDVVGNDNEHLRRYLGEPEFRAMASQYIAANPSQHPNARWFSRGLPEFLRTTEPYAPKPVLADLAALERALNDAFDADDAAVLGVADLAAIPAATWAGLAFVVHPSAACLEASTNAGAIWMALKADEEPPPPAVSAEAVHILVWRHASTAMFREVSAEEAMMWQLTAGGASFGDICQMMAVFDSAETAPSRAAGILKTWLDVGLLSRAVPRTD